MARFPYLRAPPEQAQSIKRTVGTAYVTAHFRLSPVAPFPASAKTFIPLSSNRTKSESCHNTRIFASNSASENCDILSVIRTTRPLVDRQPGTEELPSIPAHCVLDTRRAQEALLNREENALLECPAAKQGNF